MTWELSEDSETSQGRKSGRTSFGHSQINLRKFLRKTVCFQGGQPTWFSEGISYRDPFCVTHGALNTMRFNGPIFHGLQYAVYSGEFIDVVNSNVNKHLKSSKLPPQLSFFSNISSRLQQSGQNLQEICRCQRHLQVQVPRNGIIPPHPHPIPIPTPSST